ncbi:MAG: SAM-dependent methyltransferase [Lachnospiraceae bacterium]|nr:SAM-dependent methyltransferase [Lachnospiraceae bacterium]MEE1014423.1 SAM-dependent methyltransferase [Lachnospiraceae bacterium]
MERLKNILEEQLTADLSQIIISNPRRAALAQKVKIRPVLLKEELNFQVTEYKGKQVFHENLKKQEASDYIADQMENFFGQMVLESTTKIVNVLVSKKGTVTIKQKQQKNEIKPKELSHNRKKRYILEEGIAVPFLVDLGVQTKEGKIVHSRYDKFRQINRFLEFIQDIVEDLPKGRELTIVDFGCGKSYLTFAMYHYLKVMKGFDIRVIGLDLKEDVIAYCNELKDKYGYEKMSFTTGDIASYTGVDAVDMVVTLHACDTATDYALEKAVKWGASVILSVPCCQHELNYQMKNEELSAVLKYGLLKERIAALVTDGLRAEMLEQCGYDTQVLEFIDMEHTPKNILIRGVKKNKETKADFEKYDNCCKALGVDPMLGRLLKK